MATIFVARSAISRVAIATALAALCSFCLNIKAGNNLDLVVAKKTQVIHIESIEINYKSTISSDLQKIWHNPDEAEVCIRLNSEARCPHPSLVGRLSGQSVAMLEWSHAASIDDTFTEYCGSYANSWIDPGMYFLEIIIIHCNGFGITALERMQSHLNPQQNNLDVEKWLAFDFMHECVEDSSHHRLTAKNAFVSISKSFPGIGQHHMGHWVSKTVPRPHFTRHQPIGCKQDDHYLTVDKCKASMKNSRIDELSFVWNQDQLWSQELEKVQFDFSPYFNFTYKPGLNNNSSKIFHENLDKLHHKRVEEPPICLWGDSHSVRLWNSMLHLNLGHRFALATSGTKRGRKPDMDPDNPNLLFPELDEAIAQAKWSYQNLRCTTFVLAVGQWPSSHQAWNTKMYGRPFSFGQFYGNMSAIVQSPEIYKIDPNINIVLRTIHLNPLGFRKNECGVEHRPKDWRSPTVIDGYNHVIRQVVEDAKQNPELRNRVHFLDTRFVNEPLWDTSVDFNHINPKVSDVEAWYIAGKLLVSRTPLDGDGVFNKLNSTIT